MATFVLVYFEPEKFLVDCACCIFSKILWDSCFGGLGFWFFGPYCEPVINLCTVWMWSFQNLDGTEKLNFANDALMLKKKTNLRR